MVDLYAVLAVRSLAASQAWYETLLGKPADFLAGDSEAVWELAEHRCIAIEVNPEHAGHSIVTVFVDDFDQRLAQIAARGLTPAHRETYGNGVRKARFLDPDGNEFGFGGAPA